VQGDGGYVTFDQEVHDRIQFTRNALKVVVAQVRFPISYRLAESGVLATIQEALLADYPIALPRGNQVTIAIGPSGPVVAPPKAGPAQFANSARTSTVTIGEDTASFETTAYTDWPSFVASFENVLRLVDANVQPVGVDRLGLRWVDEIPSDGARTIDDWGRLMAPSLLGDNESPARDPRIVGTQQHVVIDMGHGDTINLRHGYSRNMGQQGPQSVYLIDTDVSAQNVPWDIDDLLARAGRYHHWAWNLFIRSLTAAGRDVLGRAEE
jgi:uncharacterized protein (TIGR04255 family)